MTSKATHGRARRAGSIAVKILVSLVLLWILRTRVDVAETVRQISAADLGGLAIAAALFLGSNLLGAIQWRQLLLAYDLDISLGRVVAYHAQGLFFGMFLPANVGGDVSRVVDASRRTGQLASSVVATVLDRLVGFWSLSMMAVLSLALAPDRLPGPAILVPIAAFSIVNLAVAAAIFSDRVRSAMSRTLGRVPAVGPTLESGLQTLGGVAERPRLLAGVLALSMVVQVLRVVVHFAVAQSMGIDLPLWDFFVIIPVLAVLVALPISFGGIGVRETAAVPLFGAVGVAPAAAVGMQLTAFLVSIAVNLSGWFIFLARQVRGSETTDPRERGADVETT